MYTLETGDIIEVRVKYQQSGQALLNVFHYRYDGVATLPDGNDAMGQAMAFFTTDVNGWVETWKDLASTECSIKSVEAQVIFPIRRPYYVQPGPFDGSAASPALPQNVQLGLTKVGSVTGRGKTGRVEVPGIVADQVVMGETTSVGRGWLLNLGDALMQSLPSSALGVADLTPVIWRRGAPLTTEAITAMRAQTTVRVDHRRTVRVGQ